jgi:hypothetical protein
VGAQPSALEQWSNGGLAVSLGLAPVVFDDAASDLVVVALSRIARARHGDAAVVRYLARPQRAPAGGISAF